MYDANRVMVFNSEGRHLKDIIFYYQESNLSNLGWKVL